MGVRKIFIVIPIILFVLFALTTIGGWLFYKRFIAPFKAAKELPLEIREARVIVGADFLSRNQFFKTKGIEDIRDLRDPAKVKGSLDSIVDIAIGELDGKSGIDICVAGRYGAMIVDGQGNIKEQMVYQFENKLTQIGPLKGTTQKSMLGDMQVIDIEGDGVCEYLGRGSLDGAAVFDHQGKLLWSYGEYSDEKDSIDDMAVGDLDGDGVAEFVASWNGIQLFDRYGAKKWEQLKRFSGPVEITDTDGEGRAEIISVDGRGLTIRDGHGEIIKTVEMPTYLGRFSLSPGADGKGPTQLLNFDESKLSLIDFEGKVIYGFEAPLSKLLKPTPEKIDMPNGSEPFIIDTVSIYKAEGVWVTLRKDSDPYFAVVAPFTGLDHSLFYVYDSKGKLVYHEVMPEACYAIALLKSEDETGVQSLLVGGQETVWRYTAQ